RRAGRTGRWQRRGCGRGSGASCLYQMVDECARQGDRMIRESLANKRIAITGSTGFVGTALVERLLRAVPECTLVLLVRPSKRHDATERVRREIFKKDDFDRLRAELKDTDEPFEAVGARRGACGW